MRAITIRQQDIPAAATAIVKATEARDRAAHHPRAVVETEIEAATEATRSHPLQHPEMTAVMAPDLIVPAVAKIKIALARGALTGIATVVAIEITTESATETMTAIGEGRRNVHVVAKTGIGIDEIGKATHEIVTTAKAQVAEAKAAWT